MTQIADTKSLMNVIVVGAIFVAFSMVDAKAANTPCSGSKGGISHCQGETFICNDGSVSASKKSCQAVFGGNNLIGTAAQDMTPASTSECSCRSGSFCIGPRGGHYCISDNGKKSYLRK